MADESDDLVLSYLRRIDRKLDRLIEDVSEVKTRMAAVAQRLDRIARGLTPSTRHTELTR